MTHSFCAHIRSLNGFPSECFIHLIFSSRTINKNSGYFGAFYFKFCNDCFLRRSLKLLAIRSSSGASTWRFPRRNFFGRLFLRFYVTASRKGRGMNLTVSRLSNKRAACEKKKVSIGGAHFRVSKSSTHMHIERVKLIEVSAVAWWSVARVVTKSMLAMTRSVNH